MTKKDNGNGADEIGFLAPETKRTLNLSSAMGLIGQNDALNAIAMLIQPGKGNDPTQIAMRTSFKDERHRIAWMREVAQCLEHNDEVALKEALLNLYGAVSEKGGMARNQLVQAIIGDRTFEVNKGGGGVGEWLKNKAGVNDGNK